MAGTEANPYSGGVYTCSKLKLDSLFLRWFSLPQSQQLVRAFGDISWVFVRNFPGFLINL